MKPDFVGIGAQRAATTWLYECLKEHPHIFMPDNKEIHFFDELYENGFLWYEIFFEKAGQHCVKGEITPNYFHIPFAVDRMVKALPHCKYLMILRNPIDRARSAYELYHEHFKGKTFEDAFLDDLHLQEAGLYGKHLSYLLKKIDRKQLHIIRYEEVRDDPVSVIRKIYCFLKVDENFVPSVLTKRFNRIILPGLQSFLKSAGLGFALACIKRSIIGDFVRKIEENAQQRKRCVDIPSNQIVHDFYRKDIKLLQDLLQMDFSCWLT